MAPTPKPICAAFILLVLLVLQLCSFHAAQDSYDHNHSNSTTKCLDYERRALLQFKEGLYDPAQRLSSWSSTTGDDDCCSWTGITCSNLTTVGHVVKIDLRNDRPLSGHDKHGYHYLPDFSTALGGELHPSLLLLKHLQYLDLSFNHFNGLGIPAFIGSFRELRYLYLSRAGFTGNVPSYLGNLSNLQLLDLSDYPKFQRISIDDTNWISRLGSLEYLDLTSVSLAKDPNWLHSLNMLPSLLEIRLSGCNLFGSSLSLSYVNFTSLSTLDLSHNSISSTMPPWLFNLSRLEYLYLNWNSFRGQIPASISNLTDLKVLDLTHYTRLNVALPSTFGNLCNLHSLILSRLNLSPGFANFHGIFSGCIKNSLIDLHLQSTSPPGNMLDWIGSLKKLKILDLSMNDINTTLPSWLFNLTAMSYLDLRSNDFHGSVPSTIGNMISLESLFLSDNPNLDARMPVTIGNLCSLKILDLRELNCSQNLAEYGDIFSGCIKGSLQQLFLQETSLTGQIPHEIGNLKNLTHLDISGNSLSDSIPQSICSLGQLQYLDLSYNELNGTIPETLGNLKKFWTLDLSENSLSGSIPQSIGSLWELQNLQLSGNRLNGTIPESLGQVSELSDLLLGNNNLKGVLSEAFFANLTKLKGLELSSNSLVLRVRSDWIPPFQLEYLSSCIVGPQFPAWLRTQANLNSLDMSSGGISDAFPDWFWDLTGNIHYLNLAQNAITGMLPDFLNLSFPLAEIDLSSNHLEGRVPQIPSYAGVIDLSNNSFSGPIDTIIGSLVPFMSYLSLSMNNISGSIPLSLCNMAALYVLDLSKNHLSGELPDCWNESAHMLIMDFSNNNISGDVPNSICSSPYLKSLHLNNNGFSGLFPTSLRNCTQLFTLDLSHNKFHGNIPDWIAEAMPNMNSLSLKCNDFSGYLPPQLSLLTELHLLDLSNNKLFGSIPKIFGEFKAMRSVNESSRINNMDDATYLMIVNKGQENKYEKIILTLANVMDLSNNHLSGSIPEMLMNLSALQTLNLSKNHLTGGIPQKIGELQSLESLDLSMNDLTGVIPSSLANLNFLGRLNLSYNNFSGRIPSGKHFDTFGDTSIYIGNHDLCGHPLDKNCTSDKESPSSTYEDKDRSDEEWFYISMGIGFVFGLWTVFVIMLFKKNWRIAYFRSMDSIYDRVYVAVMVFFNRVKRKCQGKA